MEVWKQVYIHFGRRLDFTGRGPLILKQLSSGLEGATCESSGDVIARENSADLPVPLVTACPTPAAFLPLPDKLSLGSG